MLERILEQQTKEGFFPTYRAKKGKPIIESENNRIDNIGIHTFIIEKLLDLEPLNPRVREAFQKGLDFILNDTIEYKGRFVWGWLKNPLKESYLYPPDYDDTARARAILEIAQINDFEISTKFKDFDYGGFLSEGLTRNGVLTFVGDKSGNVVCPVVNANILYSYGIYLKNRNLSPNKNKIYNKIRTYLKKVVDSDEFQLPNLSGLSKFYLSPPLFAYLVSEQKEVFNKITLNKVKERIERENGEYRNPLEAAWATSSLINLNGNNVLIDKGIGLIQQSVNHDGLWNPEPFYQHQRLDNLFGSKVGTSIFCIEAMRKTNHFL